MDSNFGRSTGPPTKKKPFKKFEDEPSDDPDNIPDPQEKNNYGARSNSYGSNSDSDSDSYAKYAMAELQAK